MATEPEKTLLNTIDAVVIDPLEPALRDLDIYHDAALRLAEAAEGERRQQWEALSEQLAALTALLDAMIETKKDLSM